MKQLNKVLIVDDDFVARFLIERTLVKSQISKEILSATNGQEAVDILTEVCLVSACPELILVDINMPIMDGFEFLESIHSSGLAPLCSKIILLTSSNNPQDVERAKRYPIAAYMLKPLTEIGLTHILTEE